MKMWRPNGEIYFIDLGHDYFILKLTDGEDYKRALTGGPWMIANHYLTLRKWHPDFRPSLATVTQTAVWIRLPELPIEYFDSEVLLQIGKTIGKPIQIDTVIELATRGRFAKICVQIDLSAPLIPWIIIGKHR